MKLERGMKNIFFSILTQSITIALGLIVPRLILVNYGSETNGFFSTVNNIYAYLAVLEAGVGTASIQALYGPVVHDDYNSINGILAATRICYRRCAKVYLCAVIILSCVLPIILDTSLETWTIVFYVFIQGLIVVINFFVLSTLSVLLSAEGKNYIKSNIALVSTILTNVAKIILVNYRVNIVFLQIAYLIISLVTLSIYMLYFKKQYKWIDLSVSPRMNAISQQKFFLIHQVSYIVFNNIDTVIISVFCGLKTASVYAIYSMVFNYVGTLFSTIFNGINFTLGQTYNQNQGEYNKFHDAYKTFFCALLFALISVCYLIILPFISLYTSGVTDIKYIDKYLPLLFCLVQLMSGARSTEADLINIAQKAKETVWRTVLESIINLVLSLILVQVCGIYGVLLGTIVAMLYRANDILIFANKHILNRSPKKGYAVVILNFVLFIFIVLFKQNLEIPIYTYIDFLKWGIVLVSVLVPTYLVINSLVFKQEYRYIKQKILPRLKERFKRG